MITADSWTQKARETNGFDYETATDADMLDHMQMLESTLDALDEAAARNAKGELSAADLAGVLFHHGLGNCKID